MRPPTDQLALAVDPSITVYVLSSDNVLIDVIEDVDLGDRLGAWERGRTSLHEACLWAGVATERYRRGGGGERELLENHVPQTKGHPCAT